MKFNLTFFIQAQTKIYITNAFLELYLTIISALEEEKNRL